MTTTATNMCGGRFAYNSPEAFLSLLFLCIPVIQELIYTQI